MKIGIIGAGNIGSTLARKLAASGHDVKIANSKDPATIRDIAREVGATAVSADVAVRGAEMIILSIPFGRYPDMASLLHAVPPEVPVVDTANYYPLRDGAIAAVDGGTPESVWASEKIGRRVVKAWNAALAETLAKKGQPRGAPGRIAIPVAGDNSQAKTMTAALVDATGFDALDAGDLDDSWRQQPGTPAYCTDLTVDELKFALRRANRPQAPANRDALLREFMAGGGKLAHDHVIGRNRAVTGS
ncbi:NADPH-dependent F420 reductase [Bradyrhizobium sp. CCBAU 51627]|uniref:NADPH-dependent F420 reductase n=1 Tax=Bradyrhizobium sp. CCBAU 51627 TaxID=1325088 RepID=UPI0023059957|nr:NAD(P)-binding domain-containing protein [Bradyrhizobium sp. CCBAU 51627]MDA9433812.1 3-hydroxyisobutyrate dehydrogenase [Bradyrhizobium sp. CCBAU 51627]